MPRVESGFCIDLTEDMTRESRWTGVSSIPFIIVTKNDESDSSDAMPQSGRNHKVKLCIVLFALKLTIIAFSV